MQNHALDWDPIHWMDVQVGGDAREDVADDRDDRHAHFRRWCLLGRVSTYLGIST